ncbi:MAG: galactokinase [Sphingomonadales bacterium]|nr:galactokinase [Sphingomonadales bacterium]
MIPPDGLLSAFVAAFGEAPTGFTFAPGRVNLIGDHVDYCEGLVLPMPIASGTWVAWAPQASEMVEAVSLDYPGHRLRFRPNDGGHEQPGEWTSYVRGMAEICVTAGMGVSGSRLAIQGTMPRGAGLSSSASLCIAVGRALAEIDGSQKPDDRALALAAQATEHNYAAVNCGIMDQMAVAMGKPGHALLLDCRDLSVRSIPLPDDWGVAVIPSGVERGLVDGAYNARRRDCEQAATALGQAKLRDVDIAAIAASQLDTVLKARATHVVSEITRTAAAVAAMGRADLAAFGNLLRASHASLRDLFEVSHPEVDTLVNRVNSAIGPNGGARMTGGGFGGAIVAVVERGQLPELVEQFGGFAVTAS